MVFLGIDTSAYTTSLAVVDESMQILVDERIMLKVDEGKRGLRQSEALFLHVKNLPVLFERVSASLFAATRAVAVSSAPRTREDSYMPVFLAGASQARVLSAYSEVPLYQVSHQEGHIMAGLHGNRSLMEGRGVFLAVHFSGGTSDLLHVSRGQDAYFSIATLTSGTDLHAGQLVDRVGVLMGLPFPAGPALEEMAVLAGDKEAVRIPSSVAEAGFSFSGAETRAQQMLAAGTRKEEVAAAVFRVIANTLEKILRQWTERLGTEDVLLAGGVMANRLIRQRLVERLEHPAVGLRLHFAAPRLSTDNAVGVAMLAAARYKETKRLGVETVE